MDECNVTFKATVNGLVLIMKEEDDFEAIYEQVEKKLASAGKFFKGASLTVKYRGRKLAKQDEDRISELMISRTGAEIKSFEEDTEEQVLPQKGTVQQPTNKIQMKKLFFRGIDEGNSKFFRGTVRSGQLISFRGNVVVIGDVNPGGQVEATGNIIVMGSLRGMVHAGADGNKDAVVAALNLQPTQLRIADIITRPPDDKGARGAFIPEIAVVKDDMIYIERFLHF